MPVPPGESRGFRYNSAMSNPALETVNHRLVTGKEANHYGTLYAGSILTIGLECAYATAARALTPSGVGQPPEQVNLVLRRVLSLDCHEPVRVGEVIEIRGRVLLTRRAYLVVGLVATAQPGQVRPWMDGLMNFASVGPDGQPIALPDHLMELPTCTEPCWAPLLERLKPLMKVKPSRY